MLSALLNVANGFVYYRTILMFFTVGIISVHIQKYYIKPDWPFLPKKIPNKS